MPAATGVLSTPFPCSHWQPEWYGHGKPEQKHHRDRNRDTTDDRHHQRHIFVFHCFVFTNINVTLYITLILSSTLLSTLSSTLSSTPPPTTFMSHYWHMHDNQRYHQPLIDSLSYHWRHINAPFIPIIIPLNSLKIESSSLSQPWEQRSLASTNDYPTFLPPSMTAPNLMAFYA